MYKQTTSQNDLNNIKVSLKLASLWASFMFLYIYIDYFHLYMPGQLQGLLAGKVFVFRISQAFLLAVLATVTIPASMIFLSITLPLKANRRANMIVASVYIPYTLFNLVGEAWMHMVFGALVEVLFLCLIISSAYLWAPMQPSLEQDS